MLLWHDGGQTFFPEKGFASNKWRIFAMITRHFVASTQRKYDSLSHYQGIRHADFGSLLIRVQTCYNRCGYYSGVAVASRPRGSV
jgi:hypothetical protein